MTIAFEISKIQVGNMFIFLNSDCQTMIYEIILSKNDLFLCVYSITLSTESGTFEAVSNIYKLYNSVVFYSSQKIN